jgi:hypothetical protein
MSAVTSGPGGTKSPRGIKRKFSIAIFALHGSSGKSRSDKYSWVVKVLNSRLCWHSKTQNFCHWSLSPRGNQCRVEFTGAVPVIGEARRAVLCSSGSVPFTTVPGRRSPLEMTSSMARQHDNSIRDPTFWRASIDIGAKSVVLNDVAAGLPRISTANRLAESSQRL